MKYISFNQPFKDKILVYGYTLKTAGSFKNNSDILTFLRHLSPQAQIITMKQEHTADIATITKVKKLITTYPNSDGLFYPQAKINTFLIVKTADCLPVLVWDKKGNLGVAHAGWQGSLNNISGRLINLFLEHSTAKEIFIFFGPAIGPCCYSLYGPRLKKFRNRFPKWQKKIIIQTQDHQALDLKRLNALQAQELKIPTSNIKTTINCTSCQKDRFFSYHRDKKVEGNIISWLGLIKKKVYSTPDQES